MKGKKGEKDRSFTRKRPVDATLKGVNKVKGI